MRSAWMWFAAAVVFATAAVTVSAGVVLGAMCAATALAGLVAIRVYRVREGLAGDRHPDPGVVEGALWWGSGRLVTVGQGGSRGRSGGGVLVVHRGGLIWQPSQAACDGGAVRFRWSARDLALVEVPVKVTLPVVVLTVDGAHHEVHLHAPAGCRAALADAGLPVAL